MNLKDAGRAIFKLCLTYGEEIKSRDVCLLIETTDGDTVVAELTDIGVYENNNGEKGLDFIAKRHGGDKNS